VAAHEEQDERVVLLHHSLAVQCGHDRWSAGSCMTAMVSRRRRDSSLRR
jgi:hypothetical protein